MTNRSSTPKQRQKKLLEDCLVLLVSLVLTEPFQTERQQKMTGPLIKRIKKELS